VEARTTSSGGAGDQWNDNTLFGFHGNALTSPDAFREQ
jgi:arabinogalactan endo-1,4-beta-galactosidase